MRDLPEELFKVVGSSDRSEISDLAVVGDNCYGFYIIPQRADRIAEINVPGIVKPRPYENPEGKFISFTYHSATYTIKINGIEQTFSHLRAPESVDQ